MISTEHFQGIIDCMGDPVFVKDRKYRFVFVNRTLCRMSGIPLDQWLGKTDYELFPKEQADLFRMHEGRVFETGEPDFSEGQITDRQGNILTVRTKRTLYIDKAGERYLVGAMKDVTGRKRGMDEGLRGNETLYRFLVETTNTGYVIVDQTGSVFDANQEYVKLSGHNDLGEIRGRSVLEWTADYEREKNAGAVLQCAREGLIRNLEIDYVDSHGKITPVEINATVVERDGMTQILALCHDITERKRAQEQLREKTALLEAQMNASLDGIIVIDKGKKILQNRQANDLLRIPRHIAENNVDEAQLEWVEGLVKNPEQFREKAAYMFAHEGETFRDELELKDGRVLDRYSGPVLDKDGQLYGRIVTLRDITDRIRSEEALRASQLRLSEAMDLADIVYWEADPTTRTFIFNDPFYAFYGTTAEQEGGYAMPFEEYAQRFIPADDLPLFSQATEHNLSRPAEPVTDIEHRIVRRNGEVRSILTRLRIVTDDAGNIVKLYGANQNITARKQMEDELHEREERFRRMFEESPFGIAMAGADFHFFRANRVFSAMLGYTEQELASLTFEDITHPEHIAVDELRINDLINGRIPVYKTEKRYIRKDRGVVWGSSTVNVMRGKEGQFLYFLAMVEDITGRKHAEEDKARLESQLLHARKMEAVGTLAGGIAHDFNNILTALMGYGTLLQMGLGEGDPLKVYADQIISSSEKAAQLTQGLLAFSRKQPLTLKPMKLNGLIEDTKKLLERLLTEDIELIARLTPDDPTIKGDATQVDQILFNLATNARDAMPKGGTFTIESKLRELDKEFAASPRIWRARRVCANLRLRHRYGHG